MIKIKNPTRQPLQPALPPHQLRECFHRTPNYAITKPTTDAQTYPTLVLA